MDNTTMRTSRKIFVGLQVLNTTYRVGMALFALFYTVRGEVYWDGLNHHSRDSNVRPMRNRFQD